MTHRVRSRLVLANHCLVSRFGHVEPQRAGLHVFYVLVLVRLIVNRAA